MSMLKKFFFFIRKIVEEYVPMIAFSLMFIAFIIQIFSRYVLNNPLTWTYEVTTVGFVWTVILGAIFARRTDTHVAFTYIYDMVSMKTQLLFRVIGHLLTVVLLVLAIYPTYNFIEFMEKSKTTFFEFPLSIVYFPFFILLIMLILYSIFDIIIDLRKLFRKSEIEANEERRVGG